MIFLIVGVVFLIGLAVAILYFKVLIRVVWWMASTLAVGGWLGLAWLYRKLTLRAHPSPGAADLAAMERRVDEALAIPAPAPAMHQCGRCGAPLTPGVRYCGQCGGCIVD